MLLTRFESMQTARLRLRPVVQADLPALLLVNGDDAVTHHLPYDTWANLADAQAWLERIAKRVEEGHTLQLVMERVADSTVIGAAILFAYDAASSRAEIGYVLGRAHWGQGYASEAVRALTQHCFEQVGMRRLEAQVNPSNTASCKLIESLGFQLEGHLRDRYTAKGNTYGVHLYGKLASD